jgi:type I restriction enzyme M protein
MRKSLGEKRKEISREQIEAITRLYGEFSEGEQVKIFPNEAFGYLRVTVERPLRFRWEVTADTIAAVEAHKAIAKLGAQAAQRVREALTPHLGATAGAQAEMGKKIGRSLSALELFAAAEKGIYEALAIRDEEAPVITDRRGNPEPDPDLRDYENVPLPPIPLSFVEDPTDRLRSLEFRAAVSEHVRAEVLPYAPDAAVDHEKTRIGYEISLTRQFYRYLPPRPLAEIDSEIKELEKEIQALIHEVTR